MGRPPPVCIVSTTATPSRERTPPEPPPPEAGEPCRSRVPHYLGPARPEPSWTAVRAADRDLSPCAPAVSAHCDRAGTVRATCAPHAPRGTPSPLTRQIGP